jgi:hypothetical protein
VSNNFLSFIGNLGILVTESKDETLKMASSSKRILSARERPQDPAGTLLPQPESPPTAKSPDSQYSPHNSTLLKNTSAVVTPLLFAGSPANGGGESPTFDPKASLSHIHCTRG